MNKENEDKNFVIYVKECDHEKNRWIIKNNFTFSVVIEVRPKNDYDKNLRYFVTKSKNGLTVLIFTKGKKWRDPYKYLEFLTTEDFTLKYEFIDELQ